MRMRFVNVQRYPILVVVGALVSLAGSAPSAAEIARGSSAPHRGVWQVSMELAEEAANPFFDVDVQLVFTRPDGSEVKADAFFGGGKTWVGRAYCDQRGRWTWRSVANRPSLDGLAGHFDVGPSDLPGKLRKCSRDPSQFVYDNGDWFLHIGDTGYRYVVDTEPLWQQYIDQAAAAGFTKIRTWFCRSRSGVEALLSADRSKLDLGYWDEIERRLVYALDRYPHIQFQLIVYGEDTGELRRWGEGDRAARLIARYAQARFSAFPNVHWCISNDRDITAKPGHRSIAPEIIDRIGRTMQRREPWGTLLTNHQKRFSGYAFVQSDWSDIVTLEDLDQVTGELILKYRQRARCPVVLDEDRYGIYRSPKHDRYYFRRLMWASLLSGGQATYGGLDTYLPFEGADKTRGVQGYSTAVRDGRLDDGAHDFRWIHKFFRDARLTMIGFNPADDLAGGDPMIVKAAKSSRHVLVYAQNPDSPQPETADAAKSPATVYLSLPAGNWHPRWFNPRTGRWSNTSAAIRSVPASRQELLAPFPGDAVLLLERESG